MKKLTSILFALLGLVALSHATAPTALSKALKDNIGQSIPLFGAQPNAQPVMGAVVNLDTSEIDTSYYFYELIDKPILSQTDTLGWIHFAHKDSTGSDSDRVRIIWYGNPQADGKGVWSKIDSVTASGSGVTSYTAATPTAVINSKAYMAIMFTVGNPSNSAVALKSAAKGITLNRRPRMGFLPN